MIASCNLANMPDKTEPSVVIEAKLLRIKASFKEVMSAIHRECPEGRNRAVTITNLETAYMWAVKSLTE